MTKLEQALRWAERKDGQGVINKEAFLMAAAYREQQARIKELEENSDEQNIKVEALEEILDEHGKCRHRIATLELALKQILNVLGPKPPKCGCEGCEVEMGEAIEICKVNLLSPKLGNLFQVLLAEHNKIGEYLKKEWGIAEALQKECGL